MLNYADSPDAINKLVTNDFGALISAFPRFGAAFMAKQKDRLSALKLFMGKVPKGKRADAFADILTVGMFGFGASGAVVMALRALLGDEEEDDPRASLIKRLQEYQKFKNVSEKIALLPRVDRDFYVASAQLPKFEDQKNQEVLITKDEIFDSILEVLKRPNYKDNHQIDFEELSTKERIQMILDLLSRSNIISFSKTLKKPEGKKGIVVTLLASLELAKDGYVELIQNKSEELFIKSSRRV